MLGKMDGSSGGSRFVVLAHALGASRDSLHSALASLRALQLVVRNPGYGHPLRPEYVLTDSGSGAASACAAYCDAVAAARVERVGFRKWIPALLVALIDGQNRFNRIQLALPGVTPRALTSALRTMDDAGLIQRRIEHSYPPRAEYNLSSAGNRLATAALELTRSL